MNVPSAENLELPKLHSSKSGAGQNAALHALPDVTDPAFLASASVVIQLHFLPISMTHKHKAMCITNSVSHTLTHDLRDFCNGQGAKYYATNLQNSFL